MDSRAYDHLRRYGLAFALAAVAAVATFLLRSLLKEAVFAFPLAAVMLASWFGGLGPGLLATLLSSLIADYLFVQPVHAVRFDLVRVIELATFMVVAVLISSLNAGRRRAIEGLRQAQDTLEGRVQERTEALSSSNRTLQEQIVQRERAEEEAKRLLRDLGERVKELTVLHRMAHVLNQERTLSELLEEVVWLLPKGWQYPEITAARIRLNDREWTTPNFMETAWRQLAEFTTTGGDRGAVEIAYLNEREEEWEGPFLREERSLLDSLAEFLRSYLDRQQALQERVQLATEHAARIEAEAANRTKDEFLATLSHELRTPLNLILGWADMLREDEADLAAMRRGIDSIAASARVQSRLVEDLLDVSRIVHSKLPLDLRVIDLQAVVTAAVEAARPTAKTKRLEVASFFDAASLHVQADERRLQQVVSNLVSNSLKFTPPGGRIEIRVERSGDQARIIVRDTGIGIKPEFLPHVFDKFRQGERRASKSYSGLGLGLSIVRHLVEAHNGTVRAESEGQGKGSQFTVILPLIAVTEFDDSAKTLRHDGEARMRLDGVGVLVVDDDSEACRLTSAALQHCGAQVDTVGSAADAITAFLARKPDVLVIDLAMPEEDGFSLIRRIRTLERGETSHWVPAIALSGRATAADRASALSAGFQLHVAKPVAPAILAAAVASQVVAGQIRPISQLSDSRSPA